MAARAALADCPDEDRQLGQLTQVSNDSMQAIKEILASDIDSFCHNSSIRGNQLLVAGLSAKYQGVEQRHGLADDNAQIDATLDEGGEAAAIDGLNTEPWQRSQYPTEKSRMSAISDTSIIGIKSVTDFQTALAPNGLSQEQREFIRQRGKDEPSKLIKTSGTNASDVDKKALGPIPYLACSTVTALHAISCGNGVRQIAKIMRPTEGESTLVPELVDVLENPKYHDGLIIAAQVMLAKVQAGGIPKGDYFHDIENAYRKSGLGAKDAREAAWKTVGVIATGGSNIGRRALGLKLGELSGQVKIALEAIAVSNGVLDFRSERTGHLYSYPESASSTCDTGTSYHFWMAAYLARRATESTGSAVGGAAAAFTTEKGYEMISTTGNRDPQRTFTVASLDDFNNVQRMNMAMSAAGAVYGANEMQGRSVKLNQDDGLRELIRNSGQLRKLTPAQSDALWGTAAGVGAFRRWQTIFAPDSVFRYYQNHL